MGFFAFWRADLTAVLDRGRERSFPAMAQAPLWMMGWAASAVLLLLLLLMTGGYHAGFHSINGIASSLPSAFWEWLTLLGDERLAFAVTLLFARRRPEVFWALVLAGICGLLYTHSLKPWFGMLRPPAVLDQGAFNLIGPAHQFRSFPSGHSLTAGFFLGVWVWFVRDWRLRLALILLAYGIGLSRVVVGVHWPVDVAGGILGGCLAAWAGVRLSFLWRGGLGLTGHFICLALSMGYAFSLFYDDGGYHQAALFQILAVLAGYLQVAYDYYLAPCRRWKASGSEGAAMNKPSGQASANRASDGASLLWVLSLCLLMQLLFLTWPEIDLAVSGWFYRDGEGFFLSGNGLVQFSYQLFARLHFFVTLLLVLLLVRARFCRGDPKPLAFLLIVLVLGPGLLVNEVLKADSGRARPAHTERFGGDKAFSPAFAQSSQCKGNCSFVSGHAAMGFYLMTLAWVFRRRRWLVAGMILGGLVGFGRVIQGAHFLSDVLFAFWAVYLTALLMAWLFFGTTRITSSHD